MVDVASTVERLVVEELGRGIGERADNRLRGRDGALPNEAGNTEVGQLGRVAVEQDVGWLDVSVQYATAVRNVEGSTDLDTDRKRFAPVHRAVGFDAISDRTPTHVLKDGVMRALLGFAVRTHRHDVVVAQSLHRGAFTFETFEVVGGSRVIMENLDRPVGL